MRQKHALSVVGMATIIALAFVVQYYIASTFANVTFQWKDQLLRQITTWYLWAALFPIIAALAARFRFDTGSRLKSLLAHFLAGLLLASVHGIIYVLFTEWAFHPERDLKTVSEMLTASFVNSFMWRFLIYQMILSVCLALNYHRTAVETEIHSSRIEDSIIRSQIESLKMQIDPDFLFKNLNQLPNLMNRNLDEADDMVARLGDYLRMTLENSGNSEVTLREEVDLLKCYLEIENIRLSNRVEIKFDLDRDSLECTVPSLILHAPIEDAIRRRRDNDPLHLVIVSSKTETSLVLTITDLYTDSESPRLHQLLERLNALYQTSIAVRISNLSEKSTTRIEIPLVLEKRKSDEVVQHQAQEESIRPVEFNSEPSNTVRRWLVITGIFTILAVYFAIQAIIRDASAGKTFDWAGQMVASTGWYIWALFTPLVLKLSARFPLQQEHRWKHMMVHLLGFICVLFLAAGTYAVVLSAAQFGHYDFLEILPVYVARTPFAFDILCYLTIVAVENSLRYHRRIEAEKIRTTKLNAQLSRARLQALKMQLHPHFLFNSLNSISELMQENPSAAKEMIENLQHFLHLTVNSNQVHEIPFEKELEFLNCYLAIERVRFQNRLSVTMDIDAQAMKVSVPNLVLQPIVENAIRHGIAPRKTPGQIDISARRNNGMLTVSIQDNGPGLPKLKRGMNPERAGLGLSNTRERLMQLYGNDYRFEMVNAPEGGLRVTLEIPVHKGPQTKDARLACINEVT